MSLSDACFLSGRVFARSFQLYGSTTTSVKSTRRSRSGGYVASEFVIAGSSRPRTSRCTRQRPHYGFSEFTVSSAAAAGELFRSAKEGSRAVLDEYDLTVIADPDHPDEYVLVPPDHPAVSELSSGGAKPCGIEIVAKGGSPEIQFGVSVGPDTRRLVYWWADWYRVAEAQRKRE